MDTTLAPIIESLRRYTAFRAWFAEVLLLFSVLMLARLAAQVWESVVLDDATVWAAWWGAYDGAGAIADDSLAIAIAITALLEGGIMFLARKRIAIAREDGHEEGRDEGREEGIEIGREEGIEVGRQEGIEVGRQEGRVERAELAAQVAEMGAQIAVLTSDNKRMQEQIHRLQNGHSAAGPSD